MLHSTPARALMLVTVTLAAIALLDGCGGSTKTVSVAGAPTTPGSASTPAGATAAPTTSTGTTPAGVTSAGGASGGTPATTSTRTATAPAFTEQEKNATTEGGLPAALAILHAHGYTASATSDYHPDQTLRVLVGTGSHSNDGYDKQAFFFLDGRYLGTDSSRPSAQISIVSQSDTEVTLAYQLYRPDDPLCCPGGGTAQVRFQLNNGRLVPLDPIPPVNSATGTSRQ